MTGRRGQELGQDNENATNASGRGHQKRTGRSTHDQLSLYCLSRNIARHCNCCAGEQGDEGYLADRSVETHD